jgi:Flp pilus assembly pilin Flp
MQAQVRRTRLARKCELTIDDRGLSTVEYVIILVLIAVACIGVWQKFGATIQTKIQDSNDRLNDLSTEDKPSKEAL